MIKNPGLTATPALGPECKHNLQKFIDTKVIPPLLIRVNTPLKHISKRMAYDIKNYY